MIHYHPVRDAVTERHYITLCIELSLAPGEHSVGYMKASQNADFGEKGLITIKSNSGYQVSRQFSLP